MSEQPTIDEAVHRIPLEGLPGPMGVAVAGLDRVVPIAGRVGRHLARLAAAGASGTAVVWVVLAAWRWPLSTVELAGLAVGGLVLFGPAAIPLAYRAAPMRYAAANRLRALPTVVGERTERVLKAVREVRVSSRDGIGGTV